MEYSIASEPGIFRGGTNIIVSLSFSPEERQLIAVHGMASQVIVRGAGKGEEGHPDLAFKEFYGGRTSWHAESAVEAKQFIHDLNEGFRRFRDLLLANSSPPEPVFEDFTPLAFDLSLVPPGHWFEHTYILGESGGGKTQLIQALFLEHRARPIPPGFVIIDSQNRMLPLIKQKFPDAVHIDPEHNPPHIDLFNLRVSQTDSAAVFRLMDTFRYLFEAGGEPITGRQRTVFERGVALMFFGYPKAHGRTATIDDFEDFFEGTRDKRSRVLSENARKAIAVLPAEEQKWYNTEYQNFDSTCTEILQRLANIIGRYSPLRPMLTKGTRFDLGKALDSGGIVLVNTNQDYLQDAGSAFLGRFFIKLIEQHMPSRSESSHPLFLVVDEVQEYFDNALMKRFPDQARKRRVACVFAHQRLAQIRKHGELYEALTGVAIRFATNLNDYDIKDACHIWHTKDERFLALQKRQAVSEGRKPKWADYALYLRGQELPLSVRVEFFQLESLPDAEQKRRAPPPPPPGDDEARSKTEPPRPEPEFKPGPKDMVWEMTITPKMARDGGQKSVKLPNGRTVQLTIKAGTKSGALIRFKGEVINGGDLFVRINVPPWPEKSAEQTSEPYQKAGDSDDQSAW